MHRAPAAVRRLMINATVRLMVIAVALATALLTPGTAADAPLGAADYQPSPQHPIGWRGDWTGRFTGATPPLTWSRRVTGLTTELRYQAAKPAGSPGADSRQLEYFTIKDWLVAGPFAVADPVKDIDQDLLGGEATVQPAVGGTAGAASWKFLRADVDTQSRQDHNGSTCDNSNIDFIYAFTTITGDKNPLIASELVNQVGYAHTYIFAPQAGQVRLRIPFTGVAGRFWLNGAPIALDAKTSATTTFDVQLVRGWNRLLLKISAGKTTSIASEHWRSDWLAAVYLEPLAPVSYQTRNVAWMTKMTGRSMSQPISVGKRLFLGSNISDLVCLSADDGRILWLHPTSPYDALTVAERAAIPAITETIEPLLAQQEKQGQEVVAAINAAISPQGLGSDREAELDTLLKERSETEKRIHWAFEKIDRKKYPPYHGNEVSSSNATPCSDGERIYWACGGGGFGIGAQAIMCFDLDGKRLWTHHEVMGSEEHGNHQSPTLVDGTVIYGCSHTLLALDAKTGAVRWKIALKGDMGYGNSPVVARIGAEAVIVTKGEIVRASDGGVICTSNLNMQICDITPVIENGIIYNSNRFRGWGDIPGVIAVKLPPSTADQGTAQVVWDPLGKEVGMPVRGRDYIIASPLYLDGILYGVDMTGGVIAIDMVAQKGLYRHWLDGYNRFDRNIFGVTASPTLAGTHIYITDDAGYTHLVLPGSAFTEIGKNVLENIYRASPAARGGNPCHQESFYTAPYFTGKVMYLRGEDYLYRIEERQAGIAK
jgi:outer membrane protein assembly factor BamB